MTQEQFTQTYLPFSGKMYALAYNLLRNRDEARDCVQDVFAELWQRRTDIEQDKPPLPLLLTMVRNNCFDRLKSNFTELNEEIFDTLTDNQTESAIEAKSTLTEVMSIIRQLPNNQQLVLRLRTIDGLETEQIAALTGFSKENIYTLLSRARKALKDKSANI